MSVEVTENPQNSTELADLIHSLTVFDYVEGGDGYEKSADAMWKTALAAFNYTARIVGATGFQASWAALRFYGEAMGVKGPFMVLQLDDALFPQYDLPGRVADFIQGNRDWLRDEATKRLAKYEAEPTITYTNDDGEEVTRPTAAARVVAHWRKLVAS